MGLASQALQVQVQGCVIADQQLLAGIGVGTSGSISEQRGSQVII